MSKIGEPKVRFLSLSSLQTIRGGFLLAESALFTLLSLLFAADSGTRRVAIAFFFLSTRFATSLTFVFRSFSSASRPSRAFPPTPTHSPATSSPCSSTRAPSALERKISLRRRGFRQWFNEVYGSKRTSLRSSRRCRRHGNTPSPTRTSSSLGCRKSENPRFVFFLFPHSKRVAAAFFLPKARCLPSSLCCLPRIRGHANTPLLFFSLSTRFATSLTFVFRSFSSAPRIKCEFSGPSRAFLQTPAVLQQHPRPAPRSHGGARRARRRHSSRGSLY